MEFLGIASGALRSTAVVRRALPAPVPWDLTPFWSLRHPMEQVCWFVGASACDRDASNSYPRTSWSKQPDFKTYSHDLPCITLPSLQACADAEQQPASRQLISSLCQAPSCACSSLRTVAAVPPLSLARVSLLLQLSFGITGDHTYKRAAPSSGGLCPSELFVLLDGSLYHFSPASESLTQLRSDGALCASGLNSLLPNACPCSCVFFVACNLHRTGAKYGDRCYRYVAADVGHIVENMRLVTRALGLCCVVEPVFDDAHAAAFLGIDGVNEVVMAAVSVFPCAIRDAEADHATSPDETVNPGEYVACSAPSSCPLGVTGVAHVFSSLRYVPSQPSSPLPPSARPRCPPLTILSPSSSSSAASAIRSLDSTSAIQLPPPPCPDASIFDCILARRSYRRHSPGPVPPDALHALLLSIVAPSASVSTCVRLHVIVNRSGIAPGLYRAFAASSGCPPNASARTDLVLLPVKAGALAAAAQQAALKQDVIGNAAVVLIFSLSRQGIAAAEAAAGREYRHGYIEAGA